MKATMGALIGLVAVSVAACGGGGKGSEQAAMKIDTAAFQQKISAADAAAEIVGGVQVVRVTVKDTGYTPSKIRLKKGIPARILFDQHSGTTCASQVQIPALKVAKTDLPKGKQTAVEFTPDKDGEFTFTCGEQMLEGTILVGS